MTLVARRRSSRANRMRRLMYLSMWESFHSLYSDGYETRLEVGLTAELITEFGAVSEGRYVKPPFEVEDYQPFAADFHHCRLPDLFMTEHLASLAEVNGKHVDVGSAKEAAPFWELTTAALNAGRVIGGK